MTLADALPAPAAPTRKPRRRAAALAGTVAVAAIAGGGAWAWHAWSAQGPQPAEVLPGSTLAYLAVDLDPPGGQKVAAYDALRRFPSIEKELGLGSTDDLRRSIVEDVVSEEGCELDFDQVEKWAGERAAIALVPVDEPTPVVVLQVSDAEKARAGLDRIGKACAPAGDFGYVVGDGWAVVAESTAIAEEVRDAGRRGNLADDADYQELVGASGDPGVLTAFLAPEAGRAMLDLIEDDGLFGYLAFSPFTALDPVSALITAGTAFASFTTAFAGEDFALTPEEEALFERYERYDELTPAQQRALDAEMERVFEVDAEEVPADEEPAAAEEEPEVPAALRTALEDFSGLGGTVRFDDGGLEAEIVSDPFVAGTEGMYDGAEAYDALAALPADTAVAFGAGFREGWAAQAVERSHVFSLDDEKDPFAAFEEATGLTPADLETLGGDTVAIAVGADLPASEADASQVPVALRVTGDATRIEKVLAKLVAKHDLGDVVISRRFDDGLVIGSDPSYLKQVADPGTALGDSDHFQDAVGEEKDAEAITYLDPGAGNWLEVISESDLDEGDIGPLGTASMVSSRDGDRQRQVVRISLD